MAALYTSISKPDSLKADAYIIYMMVGSYFASCKCDNAILEKRLFLNYKDLSLNKQYAREEKILEKMKKLGEDYFDRFSDMDVLARISFEKGEASILFYADKKVILKVRVDKKGSVTFLG